MGATSINGEEGVKPTKGEIEPTACHDNTPDDTRSSPTQMNTSGTKVLHAEQSAPDESTPSDDLRVATASRSSIVPTQKSAETPVSKYGRIVPVWPSQDERLVRISRSQEDLKTLSQPSIDSCSKPSASGKSVAATDDDTLSSTRLLPGCNYYPDWFEKLRLEMYYLDYEERVGNFSGGGWWLEKPDMVRHGDDLPFQETQASGSSQHNPSQPACYGFDYEEGLLDMIHPFVPTVGIDSGYNRRNQVRMANGTIWYF